jgi:polar amino acid transport system substrate-binding protein
MVIDPSVQPRSVFAAAGHGQIGGVPLAAIRGQQRGNGGTVRGGPVLVIGNARVQSRMRQGAGRQRVSRVRFPRCAGFGRNQRCRCSHRAAPHCPVIHFAAIKPPRNVSYSRNQNTMPNCNPWMRLTILRCFRRGIFVLALSAVVGVASALHAQGQNPAPDAAAAPVDEGVARVPGFWDPNRRFRKPVSERTKAIRFLTELDSPPLSFTGPDGGTAGFNVELARAICLKLEAQCTIQELKWDLLMKGISENRGDAIIAPVPVNPDTRKQFAFTQPFLGRPARFATTRTGRHQSLEALSSETLTVSVVKGSRHADYIADFFPNLEVKPFDSPLEARQALKSGATDAHFGDALTLSLWMATASADGCCHFVGRSFTENAYFGEGIAIAVDADDPDLRDALNYAMAELYREGRYFEIFLRYFPRGYY